MTRFSNRAFFKVISSCARAAVAAFVLVDEMVRPAYQPLVERISRSPAILRAEQEVSRLPRLAILGLFAVPFLIAEPLKVLALLLLGKGHLVSGVLAFAFAQLLTFVLVERVYHAGKAKLLTFPWFAWVVARLADVRSMVEPIRARITRVLRRFARVRSAR